MGSFHGGGPKVVANLRRRGAAGVVVVDSIGVPIRSSQSESCRSYCRGHVGSRSGTRASLRHIWMEQHSGCKYFQFNVASHGMLALAVLAPMHCQKIETLHIICKVDCGEINTRMHLYLFSISRSVSEICVYYSTMSW